MVGSPCRDPASSILSSFSRRAERLDAVASGFAIAVHHRTCCRRDDAMGRAEHHLLDAADAVVTDFDSLTEQRDEFAAILRSMTEAVVVTARAAK